MSRKQEIYRDMLGCAIPLIRNLQAASSVRKALNKTSYFEAELVHNLPVSILEAEFVEHDIWFLNNQARWYIENCSESISPNYNVHKKYIYELLKLVPEEKRFELEWAESS